MSGGALRIAVLAHARHPIAPPFMGGMEAHAWALVHALRDRGHHVTLVAAGDSRVDVPLLPLMPVHYDRDYPWHRCHGTPTLNAHLDACHARALKAVMALDVDVIHNNTLHRYPPRLARAARLPMVTSLHVPPFDALARAMRDSVAPWHRVTGCSTGHLGAYWPEGVPPQGTVVPNGIRMDDWPYSPTGNGEAVWAGRITPNKAPHLAIAAARRATIPLTLFGAIEDRDYFDAVVRPGLGGAIRHGGHLAGADLAREFGRASVMLFTPQWEEPFGLTAIEAMACGTPVAAIDRGAVREVLGPAGALAAPDGRDLDRAMRRAMGIPRAAVHARVRNHFGIDAMLTRYESLYRSAIAARDAPCDRVALAPIELPPDLADAGFRQGAGPEIARQAG